MLLKQQNVLFEQQTEDFQSAHCIEHVQFEADSTQFAKDTPMALEYVSKSATNCANTGGKEVLQKLNYLAVHNTKQFQKVKMWAKMEELARGRLERKVEEQKARNKAAMDSLRRDMVAWKDEAEKMNVTRGEAIQERRLFQVKAHRLECEALALGDEVRTALKKGKILSLAEL